MSRWSLDELIDQRESWAPEDWWRLELRLFRETAMVQHAVAMFSPQQARQQEYTKMTVGGLLQSFAYIFHLIGPLIGAALMIRWSWSGGYSFNFPLATAGICTAISLCIAIYSAVREYRHPRAASRSAVWMLSLMHIVPSGVTAAIALSVDGQLLQDGSWWWLVVIAVDVVVHVVMLVRGPTRPGGPQNPVDNIYVAVGELAPAQREVLANTRALAIEKLHSRGLIDAELAVRANAAPLGMLALTVAPEVQSNFYPFDPNAPHLADG